MKNVICIIIIILLCLTLIGCKDEAAKIADETPSVGEAVAAAAAIEPLSRWVPDKTFNSIIWGRYSNFDTSRAHRRGSQDLSNFLENMNYEQKIKTAINEDGEEETEVTDTVSVLPVTIKSGQATLPSDINTNLRKIGYDYIEYGIYSTSYEDIVYESSPYRIVDNLIIIYPEWTYEYVDPAFITSTDAIIEISHENTIVYEFCFDGRDLILARGGVERAYTPVDFIEKNALSLEHHPNYNSEALHEMYLLILRMESNGAITRTGIHFDNDKFGYNRAVTPAFKLSDDGTINITWAEKEVSFYQYQPDETSLWCRYIWCGGLNNGDGIILIDRDGNVYPYQLSNYDYRHSILVESLSVDYSELTESEINDLLTVHANVLEGLQDAFDNTDISAGIDDITGTITMDNAILFAVGDATISEEGRAYLDEFLDAYAAVILSDDNAGAISEIIVEGHTDSDGTYEDNLELSERRAQAVIDYCSAGHPELAEMMTAKGMSYNQPVYGGDGLEDKAASRRVVFRFILNVD